MSRPGSAWPVCRGTTGLGVEWSGGAWRGCRGLTLRGGAGRDRAVAACLFVARRGLARRGKAWLSWLGEPGRGLARQGVARPDLAVEATHVGPRLGWSWLGLGGEAVLVRQGRGRRGWARPGCRGRQGMAGRGASRQGCRGELCQAITGQGNASRDCLVMAGRAMASQGKARPGRAVRAWQVLVWPSQAGLGLSGTEGWRNPPLQSASIPREVAHG